LFDIFTSVYTGWAKLNDACYHRRQFSPAPSVRTRPSLKHGWVQTLVDPSHPTKFRKVKKSVTDVSAMSPDMLVIAFHFSPLNVNQTCFPGRAVDSPSSSTSLARCLLLLTYWGA